MLQTVFKNISHWLIAGVGAAACIALLASMQELEPSAAWLMAPFGATMVILFALPQSPLAQPRNIVFGHLLTTLVGLVLLTVAPVEPWSLGLGVGLAVMVMMATKTVHPPAGANPLVVMLSSQPWSFALFPVLAGAVLIVLFGVLYHRFVSQTSYPLKQT